MKHIIFVVVFLVAAFSATAQTASDAAELTKLLNEFLAGAGRNDAAAHDRFWAEDLIYTRSTGVRTSKEEIMKGMRTASPRKEGDPVRVFTAEDIRIQQYGDAAVVGFKLVSTITKGDGSKTVENNLNTGTFIKRNGKWQVVAGSRRSSRRPDQLCNRRLLSPRQDQSHCLLKNRQPQRAPKRERTSKGLRADVIT